MDPVAGRRLCGLVLTALITLSGCATTQQGPSAASMPAATPVTRGAAPIPVSTAKAVQVRPVALHDEAALRGLDPDGIKRLIGSPTFVRQDSGATIWQYAGRGCVMDLFWYRTEAGPTLVHMEARNVHSPRSAKIKTCLDDLWKEHVAEAES